MTTVDVEPEMKDFSLARRTIKFKIDDDVFEAVKDIPAQMMLDFAVAAQQIDDTSAERGVKTITSLLELALLPASGQLFRQRMQDKTSPIGVQTIMEIVPWLMEQYGMRPTAPSEVSSVGSSSQETGTSSTESAHASASDFSISPPLTS